MWGTPKPFPTDMGKRKAYPRANFKQCLFTEDLQMFKAVCAC